VRSPDGGILPVSAQGAKAKSLAYAWRLRHHCRNECAHRLLDRAQAVDRR
jgi:hypothetical protein